MLKKATKYERKIIVVLTIIICIFIIYFIIDRSIIDFIYLVIGCYYFCRFLTIKNRR